MPNLETALVDENIIEEEPEVNPDEPLESNIEGVI